MVEKQRNQPSGATRKVVERWEATCAAKGKLLRGGFGKSVFLGKPGLGAVMELGYQSF